MPNECQNCLGTGELMVGEQMVNGMCQPRYEECMACEGSGVSEPVEEDIAAEHREAQESGEVFEGVR